MLTWELVKVELKLVAIIMGVLVLFVKITMGKALADLYTSRSYIHFASKLTIYWGLTHVLGAFYKLCCCERWLLPTYPISQSSHDNAGYVSTNMEKSGSVLCRIVR